MIYGKPLCGWEWYQQHRLDHTQAEIDSLGLELLINGNKMPTLKQGDKKERHSHYKDLVKDYSR